MQHIVACGIKGSLKACKVSQPQPRQHTLLFILNGNVWLELPQPRQKLAPGILCILPGGQASSYTIKAPGQVLWFHLDAASWEVPATHGSLLAPASLLGGIKTLAQRFLQGGTHAEDPRLLKGYAQLIALLLRRELANLGNRSADSERLQRLEQLWKEVSQNPAEDWSIEKLAQASSYSRSHFHATVQRVYGSGAMEIVASLRMKCAMDLIQDQNTKIATAAENVGYDSPYSFSRAFKRIVGVTPESYRRSIQARNGSDLF